MSKLNTTRIARRLQQVLWPLGSAVAVLAVAATSVLAATPERLREAEAQYRIERAACLNGSSPQDRTTCLNEANAALGEARRGKLDSGESPQVLMRNAMARCAAVAEQDRKDCERMARGEGAQSGSVAGGGVLKQLVTRTPAPAADVVQPTVAPAPKP